MIIVTGATGQLGRGIVKHLIERMPLNTIGVSVREPAKASDLEALGVRVRYGDFTDPASLAKAFEGADQVLIVSSNARASGGDPLAQHHHAINAARDAGAQRIVYTSHMAASAFSAFPPMRDHAATEAMLSASSVPWTALHHGFYAASGLMLMGNAHETGVIETPADGKVAWTAHADLAEAAAIILADEGRYDGPTPPLTGAEALDLSDFAVIAAEVWGRPVERCVMADDDFRTRMTTLGVSQSVANIALGLYTASRDGEFAAVNSTLGHLLRRAPITMRTLMDQQTN